MFTQKEISKKAQEEALKLLQTAEDKESGVIQAISAINESYNAQLIAQIREEAEQAEVDKDYRESLGLRTLSANEKKFYEALKGSDIKQALTASQIDIIPSEIIDHTLDNVKKASRVLSIVRIVPANVKKWLSAEKTGVAAWGGLTDALTSELSATIKSLNLELNKLHAFLVIPKAISELSLPFVDRYFSAILQEAMQDGLEKGVLEGDGKNAPIGLSKKIEDVNADSTHKDKAVTALADFGPKAYGAVLSILTNGGKRAFDEVALIVNPVDYFAYVIPASRILATNGTYVDNFSFKTDPIQTTNITAGKAIIVVKGLYDLGLSGVEVREYDQTKAIEDANLIIAKAYGNGRPVDDSVAVVINPALLKAFVPTVQTATEGA